MTGCEARVSYTGRSGAWHAAIRVCGKVVWECPHSHPNRDNASMFKSAASGCARDVLNLATADDERVATLDHYWRTAAPTYRHHEIGRARHEYAKSVREQVRAALAKAQQWSAA